MADGKTVLRRRSPSSFRRSSSRRAHMNSAASTPRASKIVSQPGPGVAIMAMPATSKVNPNRIRRNRLAWLRVLINILARFLARLMRRAGRSAVAARVTLLSMRQLSRSIQKSMSTRCAKVALRRGFAFSLPTRPFSSAGPLLRFGAYGLWETFTKEA